MTPFTLVVIDPQVDFVTGSLAVASAPESMDFLCRWALNHIDAVESVVFSSDQHPFNHCSFAEMGGVWPPHCIRYTQGAAITPELLPLMSELYRCGIPFEMIEKATTADVDSYSAFRLHVPEVIREAKHIVLAGIAGDYCVLESLKDLVQKGLADKITLLMGGIAHIDDGTTLSNYVKENPQLSTITYEKV